MITIIDYGLGNLSSIKNMIEYIGFDNVNISSNPEDILNSSHLILPGVGSFDQGMDNLQKMNLIKPILEYSNELKKPLLGICLGMQLLGNGSEEGDKQGLGLIDFNTIKFDLDNNYKIPHVGWNTVKIWQEESPLFKNFPCEPRFYFTHSYHAYTKNKNHILLTSNYGYEFVVGLNFNNIYGLQFHPEKSHHFGMKILENFLRI